MKKMEYAMEVAKKVNGDVREVEKANGVKFIGVTVRSDSNITPTIYIDQMYADDLTIDEAAEKVMKLYEKNKIDTIDLNYLNNFEAVRPMLRARLYNKKTKTEVYKKALDPFDDLIIVPVVDGVIENGSFRVQESHLKMWGVTADEVISQAEKNSSKRCTFQTMKEVLVEMMGSSIADEIPDDNMMYVISNTERSFGAYSVIPMLPDLKEKFSEGFAIIPSSVHEVLLVPVKDNEGLDDIIRGVNETELAEVDVLGDHAYMILPDKKFTVEDIQDKYEDDSVRIPITNDAPPTWDRCSNYDPNICFWRDCWDCVDWKEV